MNIKFESDEQLHDELTVALAGVHVVGGGARVSLPGEDIRVVLSLPMTLTPEQWRGLRDAIDAELDNAASEDDLSQPDPGDLAGDILERCTVDPHMEGVIRHLVEARLQKASDRGRLYERQRLQRFAANPERFREDA